MQEKLFYSGHTHHSVLPLCSGCCEMHWICPTTEQKSWCQTGQIDRGTTNRKLDACKDLLPLLSDDNGTLRGEHVFMCQCETDGARGRAIDHSLYQRSAAREIGLVRSVELHRQIFLRQSVPVTVFWLKRGEAEGKGHRENIKFTWKISVPIQQLTYQRIKHLEPVSLRAFIQNTKESVQSVL